MRKYKSVNSINNEFFEDDIVIIDNGRIFKGRIHKIEDTIITLDISEKYYSGKIQLSLFEIKEIQKMNSPIQNDYVISNLEMILDEIKDITDSNINDLNVVELMLGKLMEELNND